MAVQSSSSFPEYYIRICFMRFSCICTKLSFRYGGTSKYADSWSVLLTREAASYSTCYNVTRNSQRIFIDYNQPRMQEVVSESWQARAENVKLLCSCHPRVHNEEDDIAQTRALKKEMLVTRGVSFMNFLPSVTSWCWPKATATVKLCSCQLLLWFERIVGHNNREALPSLPGRQ